MFTLLVLFALFFCVWVEVTVWGVSWCWVIELVWFMAMCCGFDFV